MKQLIVSAALLAFSATALAQATYHTLKQAQLHCPTDTVVWLSDRAHIYYTPGQRWYGRRGGAYTCQEQAKHAGYVQSSDGQ